VCSTDGAEVRHYSLSNEYFTNRNIFQSGALRLKPQVKVGVFLGEQTMNTISFISANFVARQVGYNMTQGWMQGDTATQAFFSPLETFQTRFDAMLLEVKNMGFNAIDLWGAHLNPKWASIDHLEIARASLQTHGLSVPSLAAWCETLEQVEGFCHVANAVGAGVIAGGVPILTQKRSEVIAILKHHNVKLGLENHPEKTASEVLQLIKDGSDGFVGAACDTGWWGTQGFSAPQAIHELKDHLLAVHLKDIKAAGAHETCKFGDGIVDIQACAKAILEIGYAGSVGIEHEPEDHDPTQDVLESRKMLETWLAN
jgi:L-ribulose-5-phosphate 3-epimerase